MFGSNIAKKAKNKKTARVVFAVLLLLAVSVSLFEAAVLAEHDCTCGGLLGIGCTCGGSCHTCAVLSAALGFLRAAFLAAAAAVAAVGGRAMFSGEASLPVCNRTRSLIWLKVKLSD